MSPARLLVLTAALACAGARAEAREVSGVEFADRLHARGETFVLHGAAALRWKLFFKPYVAALYRGIDASGAASTGAHAPKRLEIEYFYGFTAAQFRRATDEMLARNLDAARVGEFRPRIEALNRLYEDIAPGDRYALTFVPGQGVELAKNGRPLGVVADDAFGAAVFTMWLGRDPVDRDLRDALLAGL
jgi:hypothetical protein